MTPAERVAELAVMTPAEHLALSYKIAAGASNSIARPNGRVEALAYAALHAQWAAVKAAEATYQAGEAAPRPDPYIHGRTS